MESNIKTKTIKWRKLGGGSFRMPSGRIIKPNQIFEATVDEIPQAFRDIVRPVEPLPEEEPVQAVESQYRVISKGPGWYDVVAPDGKVVNEKRLRHDEARKLVEDLM